MIDFSSRCSLFVRIACLAAFGVSEAAVVYSAKSCKDLGWTDQVQNDGQGKFTGAIGVPGVCGGRVKCAGETTAEEHVALCSGFGARACTESEMLQLEAGGRGCEYDDQYVWSSTACGVQMFKAVRVGQSGAQPESMCVSSGEKAYGGRCCGDVAPSQAQATQPQQSVEVINPPKKAALPSSQVAKMKAQMYQPQATTASAEEPLRPTIPPATLHAPHLDGAVSTTLHAPMANPLPKPKLMTPPPTHAVTKLTRPLVSATTRPVSSATTQPPTSTTAPLATGPQAPKLEEVFIPLPQVRRRRTSFVGVAAEQVQACCSRFCGDGDGAAHCVSMCTSDPGTYACDFAEHAPKSERSCDELGWTDAIVNTGQGGFKGDFGVPGVCGGKVKCAGFGHHQAAKALCEDQGARLCGAREMMLLDGAGHGCGQDTSPVWTRTRCKHKSSNFAFIAVTVGENGANPRYECADSTDAESVAYGRCCADVATPAPTPVPPPGQSAPAKAAAAEAMANSRESKDCTRAVDFSLKSVTEVGAGLHFPRIGKVGGKDVDMLLTPAPGKNWLKGAGNHKSVSPGGIATLSCANKFLSGFAVHFVEAGTSVPVTIPTLAFTVYDIASSPHGPEQVTIYGISHVTEGNGHDVYYEAQMPSTDTVAITSLQEGTANDAPTSVEGLSSEQLSRAITVLFKNKASFRFDFDLRDVKDAGHRNLVFSLKQTLVDAGCTNAGATPAAVGQKTASSLRGGSSPAGLSMQELFCAVLTSLDVDGNKELDGSEARSGGLTNEQWGAMNRLSCYHLCDDMKSATTTPSAAQVQDAADWSVRHLIHMMEQEHPEAMQKVHAAEDFEKSLADAVAPSSEVAPEDVDDDDSSDYYEGCSKSEKSCLELGWAPSTLSVQEEGAESVEVNIQVHVCGGRVSCAESASYSEHEDMCREAGARVCTTEEMMKVDFGEEDCSFKHLATFTSTPCQGPSGSVKGIAFEGNSDRTTTCITAGSKAYPGRCCADGVSCNMKQDSPIVPVSAAARQRDQDSQNFQGKSERVGGRIGEAPATVPSAATLYWLLCVSGFAGLGIAFLYKISYRCNRRTPAGHERLDQQEPLHSNRELSLQEGVE